MSVRISRQARADLDHFRAHDRAAYENCYRLSVEVSRDPFSGLGKPQKIDALGGDVWCRRTTLEDLMVYEVYEESVIIASYRTHVDW